MKDDMWNLDPFAEDLSEADVEYWKAGEELYSIYYDLFSFVKQPFLPLLNKIEIDKRILDINRWQEKAHAEMDIGVASIVMYVAVKSGLQHRWYHLKSIFVRAICINCT